VSSAIRARAVALAGLFDRDAAAAAALERPVAQRDARRAYAVMSGLTSAGGGMVAAAIALLPERARQGRNYHYRYVWIRDQCYAGQAVAKAGPYPLMDDAVSFVTDRLLADGPQAQARLHDGKLPGARPAPTRASRLPGRL
jgi:GH15 family glucan-1,4-alpha-glucosidase